MERARIACSDLTRDKLGGGGLRSSAKDRLCPRFSLRATRNKYTHCKQRRKAPASDQSHLEECVSLARYSCDRTSPAHCKRPLSSNWARCSNPSLQDEQWRKRANDQVTDLRAHSSFFRSTLNRQCTPLGPIHRHGS